MKSCMTFNAFSLSLHTMFTFRDNDVTVVSLNNIMDKCVFMDLMAHTGFVYSSLFPNSKEYD